MLLKVKQKARFLFGVFMAIVMAIGIFGVRVKDNTALAEEARLTNAAEFTKERADAPLAEKKKEVSAVYEFTKLNETECSVGVANRKEVTKALVPTEGKINGRKYKVTEVTAEGFKDCAELVRVNLPSTVKRIGKNAFEGCKKLSRIDFSNVQEIKDGAFANCFD